jgi:hypothetical protein
VFDFDVVHALAWTVHTIFSGFVPPLRSGGERVIVPVTLWQTMLPVATVTLGFECLVAADAFAPPILEMVEGTTTSIANTITIRDFDTRPLIRAVMGSV